MKQRKSPAGKGDRHRESHIPSKEVRKKHSSIKWGRSSGFKRVGPGHIRKVYGQNKTRETEK